MSKWKTCCAVQTTRPGVTPAADESFVDDETGAMWIGNGEYSNPVNYCPFCGKKAKVQNLPPENHR